MTPAEIGMVLAVIAQAPQAYSAFLPSIMEIRTNAVDAQSIQDVRDGEIIGSAFVLLLGGAGSMLTKRNGPFAVALVSIVLMISVYEYALRSRRITSQPTEKAVNR